MTGASIEESIWVKYNGTTTTIKLYDLYNAYILGDITRYQIYYVDPLSIEQSTKDSMLKPLVDCMPITSMINNGIHQKITVTSEDNLSVTLGVTGLLLDITDWDPTHVTANLPSNTKHYVSALTSLGGSPGDKIFVRNIKTYRMTGSCNIVSLPTPNMISKSGFVIFC